MNFAYFSIATWILLLIIGLPIAAFILPRGLRNQSLIIAPLFGYGYITFVSYYVYRSNIGGTDVYAWSLVVPILIMLVVYVLGLLPRKFILSELLNRDAMFAFGCSVIAWFALSSLYFSLSSPLLAIAISNLDVAELAVESRYLQEFARDTKVGFMGQTGWLQLVGDDIWFGPSLIVAFISTLLNSEPYKLQTLVTNIIAAQGAAIFFLFSKQMLGITRNLALAIGVLYAVSPIVIYTAWQSFGAQTIAIPIILAIFHLHIYSINWPPSSSRSISTLASLVLLFSALLVTYHFMAIIVLILLSFHSVVLSVLARSWRRLAFQSIFLLLLLVITAILNPYRISAIISTYSMVATSNNGWFIPWINPLAQLGLNAEKIFLGGKNYITYYLTYPLTIGLFAFIVWHLRCKSAERVSHAAFFVGLFLPIFFVGLYFAIVGQQNGDIGSYRSFKITATFCAVAILAGTLPLTNSFFQNFPFRQRMALVAISLLILLSISSLWKIVSRHEKDVYLIPQSLIEISRIESMGNVSGVNILDMGNFSNLWANYFLLKKPQVFQNFPYGGRVVGALNQPYTLVADVKNLNQTTSNTSIFKTTSLNVVGETKVNNIFTLRESSVAGGINLTPGSGWWGAEPTHQWSGQNGRLTEVFLDLQLPTSIRLFAEYGELRQGDSIAILINDIPRKISVSSTAFNSGVLSFPSGRHIIKVITSLEPSGPYPHDGRTLGVLWRSFAAEQVASN